MAVTWYSTPEEVEAALTKLDPSGALRGEAVVTQEEVEIACFDIDEEGLPSKLPLTNEDTLKLIPSKLTAGQQNLLKRAVSYQVLYRRRQGASFFVEDQYEQVTGAGIERHGRLARVSPKSQMLLVDAGLCEANGGIGSSGRGEREPLYRVSMPMFPGLWGRGW